MQNDIAHLGSMKFLGWGLKLFVTCTSGFMWLNWPPVLI